MTGGSARDAGLGGEGVDVLGVDVGAARRDDAPAIAPGVDLDGHQLILAEFGHSGDFWDFQPEAASRIQSLMITGQAIAETTGLYGLIVAILLIFVAK